MSVLKTRLHTHTHRIVQSQPALGAEPGTAYYVSPFVPLLYLPATTTTTPLLQPGVIPPRPAQAGARQSNTPPPDRTYLPPQQCHFAANDGVSGAIPNRTPYWFFQAPPPMQSADEDGSSSAGSEEDGGQGERKGEYNNYYYYDTRNHFAHPTPAPAIIPAPRETSSDSEEDVEDMPAATGNNGETWFPARLPDRVEWDGIQGGRLMWTPHSRTNELPPPPIAVVPSRHVTPATEPAPLPPPLAPAPLVFPAPARSAPPTPQQRQRQNIDPACVPVYPYTYTPAVPVAYLPYCTPGTVPVPLVPLPGAAPARPQAQPIISPFLTPTPRQRAPLIWDAITSLAPTAGDARTLRYCTAHLNIAAVGADILNQPATTPPMPALRVWFGGASAALTQNWGPLTIESPSYKAFNNDKKKGAKNAKDVKPITIGDFLTDIHSFLHTQVGLSEWEGGKPFFSTERARSVVKRAMKLRCERSPGLFERRWAEGVKRVDVLGGRTNFLGARFVPVPVADGGWTYTVEVQFT